MKLKEQFENAPKVYNQNLESFIDYTSIADNFAIGFAKWLTWHKDEVITKEVLKRYKIEKGL